MNDFTASNGVTFERTNAGKTMLLTSPGGSWPNPEAHSLLLNTDFEPALREFFRAEEDERLGRWRWNDYVVYENGDWLTLVHELDGTHDRISVQWARTAVTDDPSRAQVQYAAIAWAAAHPKLKPWHDAQPGEVWALGIGGGYHGESIAAVQTDAGIRFIWGVKGGEIRNIPVDDRSIDYGKRIYPEGS